MPGEPRHRRRRVFALASLVILGWAGWLGVHLVLAATDLWDGVDALDAARAKAGPAEIAEGQPLPDLRRAESTFRRAHRRLTGPTWLPVHVLPVIGRQLRSVTALAHAGKEVASVGVDGVADVERLLREGNPPADARVELLRELADVAGRAEERLGRLSLGPDEGLLAPVARRRNELAAEVNELRSGLLKGSVGGRALADFLSGPRRYLVFAANNAEMRAGSGMFLSVGELETGGGVLRLGEMRSVNDLPVPPGAVPLSGELADRWGWLKPNEEWRNLMLSPRFEASAALAAEMWQASGYSAVDGVLAIDPVALQALLEASGPVTVEDQQISPDNVVEELTHGQYLRFPSEDESSERREQLGAIAQAVFLTIDAGRPSLSALASGLARAVRGRHLMAWARNAEEQAAWSVAGVDGSLADDSLLLSVINRGGNKLDRFLDVSANVTFEPAGADTTCILEVTLYNRTPAGEPERVAGPHAGSGVDAGEYLGIITASLPGVAQDGRVEGVEQLAVAGSDGPTRVIGFQTTINQGESKTIRFRFRLPGREGALTVEPTARVPGVTWSSEGEQWSDGGTHRLLWRSPARSG